MIYAESLKGIPFRWYVNGELQTFTGDNAFWCENSPPPSAAEIIKKDKYIVCTGLPNLLRRVCGLTIPGLGPRIRGKYGDVYKKFPRCVFANTKSKYLNGFLPQQNMELYENNRLPSPEGAIHSSFSFRIDIVPYYYSTSLDENGVTDPSDAQMLGSIREFILNNKGKYTSVYNSKLTCYHEIEGELK
jgi:hypothetical protein